MRMGRWGDGSSLSAIWKSISALEYLSNPTHNLQRLTKQLLTGLPLPIAGVETLSNISNEWIS